MSTASNTDGGKFNKGFALLKQKSAKNPDIVKSLILHIAILLCVSGFIPTCSRKIEPPRVIAIDILPLGEASKTAPKTQEQPKDEAKVEEPVPSPPKTVKKPQDATKMEKADKPEPVAKPEEKKPSPKKIEKKPEPEKEKKKQDQQKKDDKDQQGKKKLLKDLEKKDQESLDNIFDDAAKEDPKPATTQKAQNSGKSEVVDAAFINELMGKIQSQIIQCWNIPIGAKDVQNIVVRLYIALTQNGTVTDVKIVDQIQYGTDNVYRVVADSAVWAVKECSPLQGLPIDKYDTWKEIEFNFDPSKAL